MARAMTDTTERLTLSMWPGAFRAFITVINVIAALYCLQLAPMWFSGPGRFTLFAKSLLLCLMLAPWLSIAGLFLTSREAHYWWNRAIRTPYDAEGSRG